ncbi:MAG: hypothetical protein JOS17DRAFT_779857 [Linnemannia elongata]|nr:MAG: hypothetical protein JOS17DRAFT_779857 [Linnemannia elongata]
MADLVSASVPFPPLPSISTTSSSSVNSIPSTPTTANLFETTTLPPSISTQTTSPNDNQPAFPPQQKGLPLVPIIGAGAGVLLILFAVGVWYFLRRRRQRSKEAKSGFSIVFPDRKGSSQFDHDQQRRSRSRARNSNNSNKVGDEQQRTSLDSFPGRSFPGDQSSIHDDSQNIDLEMALPLHCSTLPFPDSPYSRPRQPPIIPVNPRSPPPTPAPVPPSRSISIPVPEITTLSSVEEKEEVSDKPNHVHIDMTDIPVVGSDEIKPVVQPSSQQEHVAQKHKPEASPACTQSSASPVAEIEETPRESTDTTMPTPVPRRPKLTVQNSSDSFIQGGRARISIAHPPPPPPTIPPPAIPSGQEQGRVSTESSYRFSIYSTFNQSAGGRRPGTSTEPSRSRRSISMDAASFTADGRRLSRRLIPPPNMPPPPIALPPPPPVPVPTLSPSLTPISSTPHQAPRRQRHQRNPSQTLNTSLFDSSDRSAISPPLSPLTIQIPRPSSRSFQSLLTINTQLTAENVQQYLHHQQPQPLEICKPDSPTDSIFAASPRTPSFHSTPRSRSRSATQLETQRIMIPSSPVNTNAFGATSPVFSPPVPPVPAMPNSLADHLPLSSPRSTSSQSYIAFKQPSLSHQQSSSSLDNPRIDATASGSAHHNQYHYGAEDNGHHDYQHYERGAHSPEPKKRYHQKQHRRRSMSAPTSPSSPSSPSSSRQRERDSSTSPSSGRRSKEESVRASATATPTCTKDQELQAIIADAIAIAAAKTAAVETARQNNFSRQLQAKQQQHQQYLQQHHQYQQHQYQQRRGVHPQIDPWRSNTPSTADSSRPGSPL